MAFQPRVGEALEIDGVSLRVVPHPIAPRIPYGQEGRQGTVYCLDTGAGLRALKVFAPAYRQPSLAELADQLRAFAQLPGLAVCDRVALIPQRHAQVLQPHPDLLYAVLMPWIVGPTWFDVVVERRALTAELSSTLAQALVTMLLAMETNGVAHCDISGPNVILPGLASPPTVAAGSTCALVDVEQLYAPMMPRPLAVSGASPGYAHRTAGAGIWEPAGDRFAGAIVLAEILGWSNDLVRSSAAGEAFFDQSELHTECSRYRLLRKVLADDWGETTARLFERAWQSSTLRECPPLAEWGAAIQSSGQRAQAGSWTDPGTSYGPIQVSQGTEPWGAQRPPEAGWPPSSAADAWPSPDFPGGTAGIPAAGQYEPWQQPGAYQGWPDAYGATHPRNASAGAWMQPMPGVGPASQAAVAPGSVRDRALALFVDVLLSTVLSLGIGLGAAFGLKLSYAIPALLVWLAYFTGCWTVLGATPGQAVFHLQVVDVDTGRPVSLWQSVVRCTAYVVSFLSLGAGFLMAFWHPEGASLPDWLARTRVVRAG